MAYRASTDYRYFRRIGDKNAAPDRERYEPTDSDEIRTIIQDADSDETRATATTEASRLGLDAIISDGEFAIAAAEAGVAVYHAVDEDGDWFAVAADSLLELPFSALSLEDRFAALDAARRLAAEDAAADRDAGTWPATAARDTYIHDLIPPGNTETVSAYLEAYATAYAS